MALERVGKIWRSSGWRIVTRPDVLYNRWLNNRELSRREEFVRSSPSKIEVEITNRCNLLCRHCIRNKPGFEAWLGDVGLEDFEKILRQFPRTLTLTLTGFGEMMIHPRFLEVVASARRILPHANILGYTNGHLIDKTVPAEDLVRSGLGQVHFSLDAATAETYQKVRCSPKFDQVIDGIRSVLAARKRLRSPRPFVGLNFTMMNDNFREAPDYVRLGAELGVDYIARPALVMTAWGYTDGARQITRAEMVEVLKEARRVAEELHAPMPLDGYMRDPTDYFAHYDENRSETFRTCFFLWNHIQIDPFGNLKLCCAHPAASLHSWGNVLETPFREIWNSDRMRLARRSLKRGIPPARICVETCLKPDPQLAD